MIMSWSDELRWLIPVGFVLLAEVLRRKQDTARWQALARVTINTRVGRRDQGPPRDRPAR
jgi:hypothetical protein